MPSSHSARLLTVYDRTECTQQENGIRDQCTNYLLQAMVQGPGPRPLVLVAIRTL